MENMETRTVNLQIRSSDLEKREIEGYAAVFTDEYTHLYDRWGDKFYERIANGAFTKTLREKTDNIFMLINHDWNKVVGRRGSNLELFEDEYGLRFKLTVPNTTDGNDLLENVRSGLIRGCSFGFNITESDGRWDDSYTEFYRTIREVELFEITATPIPAYANTEISARSKLSIRDMKPKNEPEEEPKPQTNKNERSAMLMSAFFNAFLQKKED